MKVFTDQNKIDWFLTRGVEAVYPSPEALKKKLSSGDRLRVYQGFDPTGPHLHIGHAMGIRALRVLQELGHEIIFLVGDFTARIGDPDKDSTRKVLTEEEVIINMAGWKEQAAQLIDFEGENPVQFKNNFEWLSKLRLEDIIDLMSKSTVQQMLERDLFQKRLKEQKPIQLQEFIYPLMQGYDSVYMNVDMEIGGTDQTFNMLMGRQLLKIYKNKEKFIRTNKMMDAPDGRTMSKTKGNGINLRDTSHEMYGKAMSYSDAQILPGLEFLTNITNKHLDEIKQALEQAENPMVFKKLLAYEVVKTIRGEDEALEAQKHFETTVQKKEVSEEHTTSTSIQGSMSILDFLKKCMPETSSAEIKRTIEQGGVNVAGERVTNPQQILDFRMGTLIKYGKRHFLKVN